MKRITTLLMISLLVMTLGFSIQANAAKMKLVLMTHTYKAWNDWMVERIAEYKKVNPDISIEFSHVPHNEYDQKMMVMLQTGTAPDVMCVYYPTMHDLVRGDYLQETPPDIEEDLRTNFVPESWKGSMVGDNLYGYVNEAIVLLPYVNVDIYEGTGVPYPTSYDELLEVQEKLTIRDAKGVPEQFGVTLSLSGLWIMLHWSSVLWAWGSDILTPDGKEAAFTDPAGIEAIKAYMKLAPIDVMPSAFNIGRCGTAISGCYAKSSIRLENPDLNFKALPALKGKDGKKIATSYHWTWVVNKGAKEENKRASWDFLKWLNNTENELSLIDLVGYPPVDYVNIEKFEGDPWTKTFIDEFQYGRFLPAEANWTEAQIAITTEMERILVGEVTPEEGLKRAAENTKRILAQD